MRRVFPTPHNREIAAERLNYRKYEIRAKIKVKIRCPIHVFYSNFYFEKGRIIVLAHILNSISLKPFNKELITMKFNIMFVDTSISEPESLQCLFKDEPYYVFAFDNPLDALNVIKTLEWAVVVADRSMHNMDGVEFLNKVRAHSPQTIGIIMSSYDEIKELAATLYPEKVYRYIQKPLDDIEIKHMLRTAIADYETITGLKNPAFF
jgi:CheY-like chemotaxis protein